MLYNEEKLNKNHSSEAEAVLVVEYLSGREAKTNIHYGVWKNDDIAKRGEI